MSTLEIIAEQIPLSPRLSFVERLAMVRERWPDFYDCIDLARVTETSCSLIVAMATSAFDFNSRAGGGRGESYRLAQINPMIRSLSPVQTMLISLCNLCVLCDSVVVFPEQSSTTESQRTQRLHREEHVGRLFVQSRSGQQACKQDVP